MSGYAFGEPDLRGCEAPLGSRASRPLEQPWACGPLAGGTPAIPGTPHMARRSEAKPRYSISSIRSSARWMFSVLLA